MQTIKPSQLATFVRSVAIELNEPAMICGPPGCGKSEIVRQLADDMEAVMVDIRLSQYDSVDLRGIPGGHNGQTIWSPPSTLPFLGNPAFPTDRTITLFLDEITSATPAVSAVAYQLVNDRRVGEHTLLPNVRVVAAGNREGDRGVVNRQPAPLSNRFTHVEVLPDAESWVDHYLAKGGNPTIAAFFLYRPMLITTFDPSKPAKAFATPRTWAKAIRYYESDMPRDMKPVAMAGAVGDGEAAEFSGFMDIVAKMPDLDKAIANPKKADLPEGVGMMYAVALALSVRMETADADTLANIDTYLRRMPPEFWSLAWVRATQKNQAVAIRILSTPVGIKYASQHVNVLMG